MKLDPEVAALRSRMVAAGHRPVRHLTPNQARAASPLEHFAVPADPRDAAVRVDERAIPRPAGPLRIRLYDPNGVADRPGVVYFFGGGWVTGSLADADPVCRRLARRTPCRVVAVEYRQAPEHPCPAAVEDAYAATCWVADHAPGLGIDAGRVGVGGASAGGNLAAAVTQLVRDRGGPRLAYQFLVYPPLDHASDTPSRRETVDPVFFDREDLAWCWEHYLQRPEDGDSPLASPLRAESLRDLPAGLVISAEHDPVRDETELYARRLAADGVPTELRRFDGMAHGFFSLTQTLDAAVRAQELVAGSLRRAFAAGYAPR